MTAQLIFASSWLKDHKNFDKILDDLQFTFVDKADSLNADTCLVTTTYDSILKGRNFWTLDLETKDSQVFFLELMNHLHGSIEIYEDTDGSFYARYQDPDSDRKRIFKFHFLQDLETVIHYTVSHIHSYIFEDFKDTLEYALQDNGFLSNTEEISFQWIMEGETAEFFVNLPYMREPIIHGTLYNDPAFHTWMVEEGSIMYDDAFDIYIEECLY